MGNITNAIMRAVTQAATGSVPDPVAIAKKVKPKAFSTGQGVEAGTPGQRQPSPYNFGEIDSLLDTDGYARQMQARMLELCFKEGHTLKGANPDAVRYIEQRLSLFGVTMNRSFDNLLVSLANDVIVYHNAFLVKVRNDSIKSFPGMDAIGATARKPVAGLVLAPVETMSIVRDETGAVSKYVQTVRGVEREFDPIDVIHVKVRNKTGTEWGKPDLSAAIEDVINFRIIEQDSLNVVHKEIYPVYVYYVGDGLVPIEDDDIEIAARRLEDMRGIGGLAVPGKDKVDILSSNTNFDAEPYITHFRDRAIAGLGMTPYHLGVSSDITEGVADNLDVMLYDKVKFYQSAIEDAITNNLFFELLLEGGFDPIGFNGKSDIVRFEFKEIDTQSQIARENHVSVLWLQNMITHGRMCEMLGEKVDEEIKDLYHYQVVSLALAEATKRVTGPEGGDNPMSPAKGEAGSKDQPSNQYGKRTSPKVKA